ncbi:MAG: class II aldolase/adducin family protein [Spirochaetales bacterium]|nr:class II aldolase/adducin family protein [Spirochaetales bacterium]
MILENERRLIADYGRRMLREGLVRGTSGNISILNVEENLVAISPSGIPYEDVGIEEVAVIDRNGVKVDGTQKPSSEYPMHLSLLNNRDDMNSVVHTHSSYAAAYSCLRKELPPIYYLMMATGGAVRCAEYALNGSEQLAANALAAIQGRTAVLLANHGVLTGAPSLAAAYYTAEQVEFAAEMFLKASASGDMPVPLNEEEQRDMVELFAGLGYGPGVR